MSDEKTNVCGIWGAGYQAGYLDGKAGLPNKGRCMNQKRIDRKLKDQTIIARKIYSCVPIVEEWSKTKIHQEVHRTGSHQDGKVVDGCLNSLKGSGLIKEPSPGMFIRITASVPSAPAKEVDYSKPIEPAPGNVHPVIENKTEGKTMRDPVEIMEKLTNKMDALQRDMKAVQDEFDTAALEISEYVEQNKEQVEQLAQLKKLLGNLGIGGNNG